MGGGVGWFLCRLLAITVAMLIGTETVPFAKDGDGIGAGGLICHFNGPRAV